MGNKLVVAFILWALLGYSQQHILVFSNGYLGPKKDNIPRDNGVTSKRQSYWYDYDDTIINRGPIRVESQRTKAALNAPKGKSTKKVAKKSSAKRK